MTCFVSHNYFIQFQPQYNTLPQRSCQPNISFSTNPPHTVRARQNGTKPYYWLHSYVLVLLSGFGGGILTPLFLGQPSMMLANNLLVLLSALAWFLTHYVTGMQAFFTSLPSRLVGLLHDACISTCLPSVCLFTCQYIFLSLCLYVSVLTRT
jgi:hypothetical protein